MIITTDLYQMTSPAMLAVGDEIRARPVREALAVEGFTLAQILLMLAAAEASVRQQ